MYRNVHLGVGGATPFSQRSNYQTAANHSFRSESPFRVTQQIKAKCSSCGVWVVKGRDCSLCGEHIPAAKKPIYHQALNVQSQQQVNPTSSRSTTPTNTTGRSSRSRSSSVNSDALYHDNETNISKVYLYQQKQQMKRQQEYDYEQEEQQANTVEDAFTLWKKRQMMMQQQQQQQPKSARSTTPTMNSNKPPLAVAVAATSPSINNKKPMALGARSPNFSRNEISEGKNAQVLKQLQQRRQQHQHQDVTRNSLETYRAMKSVQDEIETTNNYHQQQQRASSRSQSQPQPPLAPSQNNNNSNNNFYELYKSMLTNNKTSRSRSPSLGNQQQQQQSSYGMMAMNMTVNNNNNSFNNTQQPRRSSSLGGSASMDRQMDSAGSVIVKCTFCGSNAHRGAICQVCHMRC